MCVQDFCEELEYWGLDDLHMEPCCQHTYYRARWLLPTTEEDEKMQARIQARAAPDSWSWKDQGGVTSIKDQVRPVS